MTDQSNKTYRCEDCPLRKKAEARPKSLLGRFWFWHTHWCPGWKVYQEHLAQQGAKSG